MHAWETVFFSIGIVSTILFLPRTISYIINFLIRPCRKNRLSPRENDFAIVTGSTDGIGLEYAKQLADKGYNLLLISRSEWKLEKVRKEILEHNQVEIEIHVSDFTKTDIYDGIENAIANLSGNVAVLVNNVGMANPVPYEFADISDPNINTNVLICNTYSVTKLSEIVLRRMKTQKYGIVINVSSAIALTPFPLFSVYAATKSFVSTLSGCLNAEYSKYGIIVQDVTPNQVYTNLSRELTVTSISVSASSFVNYALSSVGKELRTSAHPKHKFLNNIGSFFDLWLPESISMATRLRVVDNMRKEHIRKNNTNNNTMNT